MKVGKCSWCYRFYGSTNSGALWGNAPMCLKRGEMECYHLRERSLASIEK